MNKHKFDYNWTLKDTNFTKDRGKVFSCFAGGGGSSLGYKLSGFDVIGCNEIDPKQNELYKLNLKPKYNYCEAIQEFKLREDLPEELYNLDILDGSFPCSSFSLIGNKDKDWGKEKKFREGQQKQVLDTLAFEFLDVVDKLKPKCVVMENVKGLTMGKAKEYLSKIINDLETKGYYVKHWILNAKFMGVPQSRERVFFLGIRKDLISLVPFYDNGLFPIDLDFNMVFNEEEIPFKEISDESDLKDNLTENERFHWERCKPGQSFSTVKEGTKTGFARIRVNKDRALPTLLAKDDKFHNAIPRKINDIERIKGSSYPLDYNFNGKKPYYVCGMSVPPLMMANFISRIAEQSKLFNY